MAASDERLSNRGRGTNLGGFDRKLRGPLAAFWETALGGGCMSDPEGEEQMEGVSEQMAASSGGTGTGSGGVTGGNQGPPPKAPLPLLSCKPRRRGNPGLVCHLT